jgi:histidine triad (HIT) family protein
MTMNQICIFCDIIKKKLHAEYILENDSAIVIKDRYPKAPIHLLIIPKKHIPHLGFAEDGDKELLGVILLTAKELSKTIPHASEFKLVANNGESAGQRVFHLHFHFLVGKINISEI